VPDQRPFDAVLETQPAPLDMLPRKRGLPLFWRTYMAMFLLLAVILLAWSLVLYWIDQHVTDLAAWAALPWMLIGLLVLTSLGAVLGTRFINRPIKDLSFAASRVLGGDLEASRLDEDAPTLEIREMNAGFNRMADQLAQVEQDRATMLAGISHDLRTPLARLRLETEISVADPQAREHMAADIEQLDRTIDKFLDYARPDHAEPGTVCLNDVIDAAIDQVRPYPDLQVINQLQHEHFVKADEVDLGRVVANLFENARRYGKSPNTGIALVHVMAKERDNTVGILIRDHGIGVGPALLPMLTKPFFRGDTARTAATGAGLGLAIVEKALQRMGGNFRLSNAPDGG
jgi:two-component system, OmpR family, osmolarity sensor histidine kinase EnvZ